MSAGSPPLPESALREVDREVREGRQALWDAALSGSAKAVIEATAAMGGLDPSKTKGMRAAIKEGELPPSTFEADRMLSAMFGEGATFGLPQAGLLQFDSGGGRSEAKGEDIDLFGYGAIYEAGGDIGMRSLAGVATWWIAGIGREGWPAWPLYPVVKAWIDRAPAKPLQDRMILIEERARARAPVRTARITGLLQFATLAAYELDGEPYVTHTAEGVAIARSRARMPPPNELFPGPRTLAKEATGGAIREAVADMIPGDGRSPLRSDVLVIGGAAGALTGAARLTPKEGAELVAGKGRDSPANRRRFERAMRAARHLHVRVRGRWWSLVDAELGPVYRLGPPRWWIDAMKGRLKGVRGVPKAWRKSGALFLPATRRGVLERTVAGIEAALAYGSSSGKGRGGRIPTNFRPARPGGPGPEVFIPWRHFLRLSGDPVDDSTPYKGAGGKGRTYLRRLEILRLHGFFAGKGGPKDFAGRTIEIVRRVSGGRGREAGIIVRATAEYCAIWAGNRTQVRVRADQLLRRKAAD